jgi:DNA-binding NtrC family response regulator
MKFIAKSESSKKLLNIAQMSSALPVNIIIFGEVGVGKKILAGTILPDAPILEGKLLEESINNKSINLDQYSEIIVENINKVLNKSEFIENLSHIKIVATSTFLPSDIESSFAIKIDIPPLKTRIEDLNELTKIYLEEANSIYGSNIKTESLDLDLSENGISLKKSIFKNTFLKSINDNDMGKSLEEYFYNKLEDGYTYKDLLEIFEIPLLKAAKTKFKSQLQMANNLQINRITLRKKINAYFDGEEY